MEEYICTRCRCSFKREDVQIGSRWTKNDGTKVNNWVCRVCNTKRVQDMRERIGMESTARAVRNYEAKRKNQIKKRAWYLARNIPMQPCEVCKATEHIHRHHDDYNQPLEVMFLCSLCHKRRHKELKMS
jgi:hypothetical protein